MPLAPSPIARALLDHTRQSDRAAVALGEAVLTFDEGKLVAIRGGDGGLVAFLERAELLSPPEARQFSPHEDDENLQALQEKLGNTTLRRARRAAWIDRLVKALSARGSLRAAAPEPFTRVLPGESVVPLLLDALARAAAHRDAGIVGTHADLHFLWNLGDQQELAEARRWLTYDPDSHAPLSRLLVRHPGAAPRLAALARAGFARFVSSDEAEASPEQALPAMGRPSLAPARAPARRLAPGASLPPSVVGTVTLPTFEQGDNELLNDPLIALEARVRTLEKVNVPGPDLAEAWADVGNAWLRIHGALDEATRAFREAAAADPTDTASLLQAAQLCIATGQRDLALAYAHSATSVSSDQMAGECRRLEARLLLQSGQPAAAAAVLRDHVELDPVAAETWANLALATNDEELAPRAHAILGNDAPSSDMEMERAQASLLSKSGHPEAAIYTLTKAASHCADRGEARALRLEAAEQAELIDRPDLSFALLYDAFLRDSSLEVLYEPLLADAEGAGEHALKAVLCERIGCLAMGPEASPWLLRAADAFHSLPSGRHWSHELYVRALEADPSSEEAFDALRRAADACRDANLLADGLERAAVRAPDASAVRLFSQLAELSENRLGSVHRAAWAWRMVHARTGGGEASQSAVRLGEKANVRSSLLKLAEEDLEKATLEERPSAVRRLAAMLRDHPEQRRRAAALYGEYLDHDPSDRSAASALRRLLALGVGTEARLDALSSELARAQGTDRTRLLEELTGLSAVVGNWERELQYAREWVQLAPSDEVAAARLSLASRLRGGTQDRIAARSARLAGRQRLTHAPLLVSEAALQTSAEDQLAMLDRALRLDPRCVPAALARAQLEFGTRATQWERIQDARLLAPTDSALVSRAINLAQTEAPEELPRLLAHVGSAPAKKRASLVERFEEACENGDRRHAEAALDAWLAADPAPSGKAIALGARKLGRTDPAGAARLLVRATDQTSDPRLLQLATSFARDDGTRALLLERQVIWDDDIIDHLHALATLRRNSGKAASEARTLVRILAEDPQDAQALERLSEIYITSGEFERLFAVYALRRNAADSPAAREDALVAMATIASQHLRDPARAAQAMQALAAEGKAVRAADILVTLQHPTAAVSLLLEAAEEGEGDAVLQSTLRAMAIQESILNAPEMALATAADALVRGVRGADLMLSFERLSLQLGAKDQAVRVYDALRDAAMGPHGRRGTTYRKARWLEHFGDPIGALDAYRQAFFDDPGDGVILSSIERIARRSGRLDSWAEALETLADQCTHVDQKLRYERRLVALLAIDMESPARGFRRLIGAWDATQKNELIPELRHLLRQIPEKDERHAAGERLAGGLRGRIAATWNSDDQAASLGLLAQIQFGELGDIDEGQSTVAEMVALLQEESDIPRSIGAGALINAADILQEDHPELALTYARDALRYDPHHGAAATLISSLTERLGPESVSASTPSAPEEPSAQSAKDEEADAPSIAHEEATHDETSFADLAAELAEDDSDSVSDAEGSPIDASVDTPTGAPQTAEALSVEASPSVATGHEDDQPPPEAQDVAADRVDSEIARSVVPSEQEAEPSARTLAENDATSGPAAEANDDGATESDERADDSDAPPFEGDEPSTAHDEDTESGDTESGDTESGDTESNAPEEESDEEEAAQEATGVASTEDESHADNAESEENAESLADNTESSEDEEPLADEAMEDADENTEDEEPLADDAESSVDTESLANAASDDENVGPEKDRAEAEDHAEARESAEQDGADSTPYSSEFAPAARTDASDGSNTRRRTTTAGWGRRREKTSPVVETTRTDVPSDPPASDETNTREVTRGASRWLRSAPALQGEQDLRTRIARGDLDAALELAVQLRGIQGRTPEALAVLLHAFRTHPWRGDILSQLRACAEAASAHGVVRVAKELQHAIMGESWREEHDWRHAPSLGRASHLIAPHPDPFAEALGIVWRDAAAVFRVSYNDLGVAGTERVTERTLGVLGESAAYVPEGIPIFRTNQGVVRVGGTVPPCILVGSAVDADALPFQLARAAVYCDPSLVLLTAFEERSPLYLDAIYAAFGPPTAAHEVSRASAEIMGELWRVLPARRQTDLRTLIGPLPRPSMVSLLTYAQSCGARGGYLGDGRLGHSLAFVGVDFERFHDSVQENQAAQAILRLAFSDALIIARSGE